MILIFVYHKNSTIEQNWKKQTRKKKEQTMNFLDNNKKKLPLLQPPGCVNQ